MTVVVGTAGHIDHGKTTLLRALTGIDADRLPEERERGMTIDVGYAHGAPDGGPEIDFVDVPGHDRLVGNMLVGAGEIDAALLVVAADDGPRAQTREHLELLDALAIRDGLAVVTKADAVPAERVAVVMAEVRALLGKTALRDIDVIAASATTGAGLAGVRAALAALRDRIQIARAADAASNGVTTRFAIDRVFSIRGRGTVVTGTLRGRPIARGDRLRVVPAGKDAADVRIREVQVHGATMERGVPGRVALNLGGELVAGLERGAVLTDDPAIVTTDRVLVALRPPADLGQRHDVVSSLPPDRTPTVLHLGTARVAAAVGRAGRDSQDLGSGETSAILRLAHPIAAAPGDRFVLRRPSPVETLAGGRILDPRPAHGVARRRITSERLGALAAAAPSSVGWLDARVQLHGALDGSPPNVAPDVAAAVDAALVGAVDASPGIRSGELARVGQAELRRRVGPLAAADAAVDPARRLVSNRVDALVADGRLVRDGDRIRPLGALAPTPPPELIAAMDRLVALLSGATPPPLPAAARDAGCSPEGVRLLERDGRIVRLADDLAWSAAAWREVAAQALAMAAAAPLTPAALRDATGSSRKYAMAILEDLDRRAILRRTPDGHVPGPRASTVAEPVSPR